MLHLDISGTRAKAITPAMGLPDQEFSALRTPMRKHIEDWLKEREKNQHAWSMDPYNRKALEAVKATAERVKEEGIQTIVWIGIGGSGLGPRVIQEAFEGPETPDVIVLDTLDPSVLQSYIQMINWKNALVVVVSKSGDTLEPMSLFFLCLEQLRKARRGKAYDRVIAITDPEKGHLRSFCTEHHIATLAIPPGVGGRYCIFTAVGLLPLALLGGDVNAFVRGAKGMDTLCQKTTLEENPAALLASVQYLLDTKKNYPIRVIMPYSTRLQQLGRWNQQLVAESLGKSETKNPIPLAALGTQDQHSLLQQWMEGPRKQWHLFIREIDKPRLAVPRDVEASFRFIAGKQFGDLLDACYQGTSKALLSVKRPSVTISVDKLDAYHLGQLFYLFLTEVVLLGKLYRIDPYGQPGVELGKTITRKILEGK